MYTRIPGKWEGYDVNYRKDGKLLEVESCILGSFWPRLLVTKYLRPSSDVHEWSQQPASIFPVTERATEAPRRCDRLSIEGRCRR